MAKAEGRRQKAEANGAAADRQPEREVLSCNQELLPPYLREDGPRLMLVSIELPVGEFNEQANRPQHIEARLSPKQGRALQKLLNGLNAKYGAGWRRRDFGFADVVRYLLDQLPD